MGSFKESIQLIYRSLRRFISLSFILASMILTVRLYELLITSNFSNYPAGSFLTLLAGIKYDIIIYLRISAVLMIPHLIIAFFSQKVAKLFFIVISLLLIFGNMLLLQYFATARVPLGADLFGYSISEIKHTVKASDSTSILPYLLIIIYMILMVRVYIKHVYYRLKPWLVGVLTLLMFSSFIPLKVFNPQPSRFNDEFSMFVANNKLNFFAQSVTNHYIYRGKMNNQTYTFEAKTETSGINPFTYVDAEYPFLHEETTPDILGNYFELGETPPNIVVIIVESLGRAYSGEDAYLGSFTPFLDSLAEKSLYWENCLSTSGRTFQVLPSTLASVPFGEHGFADLGENMPDHLSLISILKKQAGYNSTFIYGGNAEFDKMDVFLNRQGVDEIIDINKFGDAYTKLPANAGGFTWGYGDKEIFRRYIESFKLKQNQSQPNVDVMLTVAIHEPFNIPNQEFYITKFKERINGLKLSDKTRTFNYNYEKPFASVLYFDDALQYFFTEMKKLPEFSNTIFVITGDHRMPEIPISTQIDRFHVPLVIYSPMIKEAEKFSSLVTHFDITPSLIALLDAKRYITRPKVASWIGHGLDNYTSFRSLNKYPLMRNKNEILDFIDSENMYANSVLYQIFPNMNIEPYDEKVVQLQLKEELDNFILRNNYACQNNKLIPDSLLKWTVKR